MTSRSEEYLASLARFGWHLGLERIYGLLERVGSPQRSLRFAHVAGTNGKGSTSTALAHILAASGLRVGLYTSPHLTNYEERIVILQRRDDGVVRQEVAETVLERLLTRLDRDVRALAEVPEVGPPTEFEVLTAAALLYFLESKVDIVVLETGLGGRLDATNVVQPEISVITHIALDHQDRLGATLGLIADEKAAIIKPGCPAVLAPQSLEAMDVLLARAREVGAPVTLVSQAEDFVGATESAEAGCGACLVTRSVSREGGVFDLWPEGPEGYCLIGLRTPLLGAHQALNAAVAATAAWSLSRLGWPVTEDTIRLGLGQVVWPGRGEIVREKPTAIIDGAHNPDGMKSLAELLSTVFPGRRIHGVAGFLADKDYGEMVRLIAPHLASVFVTRPQSPRAAAPEEVAAAFSDAGCRATVCAEPGEACAQALRAAGLDGMVVGCGSLYLVGALRAALRGESR